MNFSSHLYLAYNVYTKPLWADKSETIYRARENDSMKYVSEEAIARMKNAIGGGSGDAEADREDARYANQSRRNGPLEVIFSLICIFR